MKRRIFTIILSLAMMVSLMPVTALAAGDGATLPEVKDGKITLVENVTLENEWLVTTDTVLDLNGYTLSNNSVTTSDYLGTITLKSGNLTIEDSSVNKTGRVEGACFAVVVQGGTLTANGGTFGKTPSATNSWNEPLFVGGGSATINNGTFVDGALEYYQVYDEPGSLVINGGQFDSMPYYPAGNQGAAILAPAPDHNYMVAYAGYGDFAAANSGSFTYDGTTNTLTLTSDYNGYITQTGDWCGFFLNKNVTIDLNGHAWDMKTSDRAYPFPLSEMVTNGGTEITIQDSSGTDAGTLKNRTGNVLEVMGTLHLKGGTLEQVGWTVTGPTVQLDGNATINMTGGTVKGTQSAFKFKGVESGTPGPIRLSISGGKIETNNSVDTNNRADATCDITGGSFKNPIEEALCANGYLPVKNEDGTYTVKKSDTMVASVTDSQGNVTEYVSLGKALGSAAAGDTVTLLTDLELQPYAVLGITEKVVLDLAGHSIHNADFTDEDADPPMLGVASGAELTVRDSRGSGIIHNVPLVGECDSTIRFESGTIDNSDLPDYWGGISVSYSRNYPARPNKALVTITGGTIKAAGSGIFMDEGTLEVTGGTISGTATGVTVGYGGWAGTNSSATAAISGGTITGGTNGIDVLGPASQVTVSGGTITGTEDNGINAEKYGTTPTVAVQGGTLTGGTYGIYASCGNQASFTVSGGFVGGTTSAMSVSSGVPMSITGGYYTSDPSEYVAEGYRITSSDESNYAYKVIQGKTDENVVPSVGETAVNMDSLTDLTDDQKTAIEASAASTTAKGLEAQAVDLAAAVTEDQKDAGSDALTEENISAEGQTVTIHAQTYLVVTPKVYAEDAADKTLTLDITAMSRLVAATTDKADDIKLTDEDGNQKNAAVIPDTEKVLTNVTTPVTISIQLPSGFVSNTTDPVYVQHKGYEYTAAVTSATENSNTIYTATFINPHGFSEFTITAASAAEAKIGDTCYTSLTDALNAAQNGETVTVLKNSLTGTMSGSTRTITLKNGSVTDPITVTVNGTEYQIAPSGMKNVTYTRPSSGGGGGGVTTYAINVGSPANGTVTASPKSAAKGATVTLTVAPTEGYQLDKLTVADKDGKEITLTDKGNGKYTFTMPASKVDVTATFKQAPVVHVCPAEKYTDVDTTQWYHEGVDYVIANGMMNGTGTNIFEPNATTTRGMIVTILYRLEKEPAAGTSPFTDVDAGQWYAKAVAWAAANGVVNGTSPTTFNPNDPITREQMAAILYRYASFKGYDVTQKADLAGFTDAAQISDYAKDPMAWANKAGLIGGVSATTLQPQGSATRAQVATILMRFVENLIK